MVAQNILCPTDFSPSSRAALRVAVRLATEAGAALFVVHVWYVPPLLSGVDGGFPAHVVDQMFDDTRRGLDDAVHEAECLGAKRVSGKVVPGVPWAEIVNLLETQGFDLCVMSTHGRTGLARILVGSVTEKVVRLAPCSVLAVRPDSEPRPFRHVLCPTDFSDSAAYALDRAAALVAPGGDLALLHVIEVPVAYARTVPIEDIARDLNERCTNALEAAAARVTDKAVVAVSTRSRVGTPGVQVLAALDEDREVDLVVMGSHGRTGIARVLMGSVAEKIVRHARCPVLVARAPA